MAKITISRENIVTFAYQPEDNEKFSCAWARFIFNLDNWSLTIESDCGNYMYTGWKPSKKETFLELCQRLDYAYLLEKISDRSEVNQEKTFEAFKENFNTYCPDFHYSKDELKRICFDYKNYNEIYDNIETMLNIYQADLTDAWELIAASIVTEHPNNAKTIASIYMTYIIPEIKKYITKTTLDT